MEPLESFPTLFLQASGGAAVLVRNRNGRRTATHRQFTSPAAALAWCLAERVNLVVYHGTMPELN